MPLDEVAEGQLVPFPRVKGGAGLYESDLEQLLWENLEEFTGETLFPIARQATIGTGGRPDIIALDESARVVVIEVKRDIDRSQLSQCLEYAGWARGASLDELAGMYHDGGPEAFFAAWQEFTDSTAPVVINPHPRLMLVARDVHGRTESALDFLIDYKLPVVVVKVAVYEDISGRRFIDVEGEFEAPVAGAALPDKAAVDHTKIQGRRMKVGDLLEHGLVSAGERLVWERPKKGTVHEASITDNGSIRLSDGRTLSSPSRAAADAAGLAAYDGWYAWTVERLGKNLNELRIELASKLADG